MSFASSSTATTEVVSKRFVATGFRSCTGVERRGAAVERGARASQMANQATCAANPTPIAAGDDQIHGETGNKNDDNTKGLNRPP